MREAPSAFSPQCGHQGEATVRTGILSNSTEASSSLYFTQISRAQLSPQQAAAAFLRPVQVAKLGYACPYRGAFLYALSLLWSNPDHQAAPDPWMWRDWRFDPRALDQVWAQPVPRPFPTGEDTLRGRGVWWLTVPMKSGHGEQHQLSLVTRLPGHARILCLSSLYPIHGAPQSSSDCFRFLYSKSQKVGIGLSANPIA